MKLKKSSSGPVTEASRDIADQLDTSASTVRTVGMVVGAAIGLAAIIFGLLAFLGED